MSAYSDNLHQVEINFPAMVGIDPEFFIKIDGKKIEGTCGVKIETRLLAGGPYPVVTISFMAKSVKGNVEGLVKEIDHEPHG
jgi:hypothetical protein